jgi:hypothetical protein
MAKQIISISLTPTVSSGVAYTSGDAVGGLLTLTNMASGGTSKLLSVQLFDSDKQSSAMDLVLFKAAFTATADNAAMAVSASDMANLLGHVSVAAADYAAFNATSAATKILAAPLACTTADGTIYGQLVARGTPTYTGTAKLTVRAVFEVES